MNDKPLEVGEIGVLQNLPPGTTLKEGMLVMVWGVTSDTSLHQCGRSYSVPHYQIVPIATGHPSKPPHFAYWGCLFHQLRRLTDPDANQSQSTDQDIPVKA